MCAEQMTGTSDIPEGDEDGKWEADGGGLASAIGEADEESVGNQCNDWPHPL